jgi:hypothetical protein
VRSASPSTSWLTGSAGSTLASCRDGTFENFLTFDLDDSGNIVDDYLKQRAGRKRSQQAVYDGLARLRRALDAGRSLGSQTCGDDAAFRQHL